VDCGAVGLDENAARRNIDHANLGAVLEPGTTQPRRVLGAETHLGTPIRRSRVDVRLFKERIDLHR
jgi:hypothetical protein